MFNTINTIMYTRVISLPS